MSNVFLISDTHFGHANICKFMTEDNKPVRPWDDVAEMDEALIQNWNSVVRENDLVYHLGDVVINKKFLPILERLNGRKRLVRGNHDTFAITEYLKYFEEVYGVREISSKDGNDGMIFSHIPLAEASIERFGVNVHGHLHTKRMKTDGTYGHGDENLNPLYFSVCVEQINYTPISLEEVRSRIRKQC